MGIKRLVHVLLLGFAAILATGCSQDSGTDTTAPALGEGSETTLQLGVPRKGSQLGLGSERYLFHTAGLDTYLVSFPILVPKFNTQVDLELALPPVQNGALVLFECSIREECRLYDSDLAVGLRPDKDYIFELELQTDDNIDYLVAVEEGEGTSDGSRAKPVALKLDTPHLGKVAAEGRSFYKFTAPVAGDFNAEYQSGGFVDLELYSDPDFTVPVPVCSLSCDFSLLESETAYIRVVGSVRYAPYRLEVTAAP